MVHSVVRFLVCCVVRLGVRSEVRFAVRDLVVIRDSFRSGCWFRSWLWFVLFLKLLTL